MFPLVLNNPSCVFFFSVCGATITEGHKNSFFILSVLQQSNKYTKYASLSPLRWNTPTQKWTQSVISCVTATQEGLFILSILPQFQRHLTDARQSNCAAALVTKLACSSKTKLQTTELECPKITSFLCPTCDIHYRTVVSNTLHAIHRRLQRPSQPDVYLPFITSLCCTFHQWTLINRPAVAVHTKATVGETTNWKFGAQ
jgi:hypothetical protein